MIITRGTTPPLSFTVPIDLTGATLYMTFVQDGKLVCEKTNSDMTVSEDSIIVDLTQEETLAMTEGIVSVQLRYIFSSGLADASKTATIRVADVLKDGVIEWNSN